MPETSDGLSQPAPADGGGHRASEVGSDGDNQARGINTAGGSADAIRERLDHKGKTPRANTSGGGAGTTRIDGGTLLAASDVESSYEMAPPTQKDGKGQQEGEPSEEPLDNTV